MEIRRLRYFVRVAEDGSLTKAAGVLRVAQPALTRQIRLLEKEIGVALFNRTPRGMQLTEEGEYLRAAVAGPIRASSSKSSSRAAWGTRYCPSRTFGVNMRRGPFNILPSSSRR